MQKNQEIKADAQILCVWCHLVAQHLRTVACVTQFNPKLLYSTISWWKQKQKKTKLKRPDHMRRGISQQYWNYRSLRQRWYTICCISWWVPYWRHTPNHIRAMFLDHFFRFALILCNVERMKKSDPWHTNWHVVWLQSVITVYLECDIKPESFTRAFDIWEHLYLSN